MLDRSRDIQLSPGLPVLNPIVEVPLITKGNNTLIRASAHDLVLRLGIGESELCVDHLLPDLWLCVNDSFALEVSDQHGSKVETLLVCDILRFGQQDFVLLRVDLHLLNESLGDQVAVLRGLDDGNNLGCDPLRLDLVVFGFLAEVCESRIVVRRVRWYTGDNGSPLCAYLASVD